MSNQLNNLARIHFDSEAETYAFIGSDTNSTKDDLVRDDKIVTFY